MTARFRIVVLCCCCRLSFHDCSEVVTNDGGENSNTTEIWVGVVSSVTGGIIMVLITKYILKEGSAG